ncbi:MAG: CarD family transcriptional regulator, partial [Pseudomonadota bacterium]
MKDDETRAAIAPGAVTICGAPEGHDARLVADLARRVAGPVIHVARDDARAAAMVEALGVMAPDLPVPSLPAWDCLPYDRVSPNPEIAAARMAVLAGLARGLSGEAVLVTTLNAATQRLPEPSLVAEASFVAQVSRRVDVEALVAWLSDMGFSRASTVVEPGDFAVRGGIIDIFPPGQRHPVRLDFFGDVLESARRFEVESQRTLKRIKRVELAPASEVILDQASITRFRQRFRATFGAPRRDDALYAAVSEGRKHQGMEHWLGLFHERLVPLFDYLPGAPITLDARLEEARVARAEMVADHYQSRLDAAEIVSKGAVPYQAAPPEMLYLDEAGWEAALAGRAIRAFVPGKLPLGPGVIDAGARAGRSFAPERQAEQNVFDALVAHIRHRAKSGPVVLASYSEGARERLIGLLDDHGLSGVTPAERWQEEGISALVWGLEEGFQTDSLTVISEQDVLGDRLIRRARKTRRAENFLTEAQSLTPGDLVVHLEHGVGRYHGLVTVEALGAPHECLSLEYHGQSKLYLPVENIELLSRYGQETGELDRLGGGAWQAKKARMKARIRDMADKLIRIAAERELRSGEVLEPGEGYAAFCARFPYQETDDQLSAIEAVISDLGSGRPMDRLVCGDVGFGKTEVALRAAYVAAAAGLQVALVAPTTLLARQHA